MNRVRTLVEQVFDQVNRYPEDIAIEVLGERKVTYREFWELVSSYYNQICSFQIEERIAIELPKSIDFVAALFGCWMGGRAPVILDPAWPDERKNYIIREAEVRYRITEFIEVSSCFHEPLEIGAQTPAYIIYSSGSTGSPKGVVVSHDGLLSLLLQQIDVFDFTRNSRSLWLHGVAFDASLSDIGTALLSGATLCIDSSRTFRSANSFLNFVNEFEISHIDIPPSLLTVLNEKNCPSCLKTLIIGGEVCPPERVRAWSIPVNLVNVYGPTEATICTSMIKCSSDWQEPVIGKPIKGIQYEIWNPKETNEFEGELVITGEGVALEYLKQPDLTANRFFETNGKRSFRTGDFVRKREDGNFVFLGRMDRQFKRNGKLVCPEEIESFLRAYDGVQKAYVAFFQNEIEAWLEGDRELSELALRSYLNDFLPDWMIPGKWNFLRQFPMLPNGKIDAQSLKSLSLKVEEPNRIEKGEGPLKLSTRLAAMMREVLSRPEFGEDDNFFVHGGDSLAAVNFLSKAEREGVSLPPDCLCKNQTPRLIAKHYQKIGSYELSSETLTKRAQEIFKQLPAPFLSKKKTRSQAQYFLTGATGFLGSAVLGELITRTESPVVCLIRGSSITQRDLIFEKLSHHGFSLTKMQKQRITFIRGDIRLKRLGLSLSEWNHLSVSCNHIIHCAASLDLLGDYSALASTNVEGNLPLVELQQTGILKRFTYASTLSVFVDALPLPPVCLENDLLTRAVTVYGGYAQTKWVAEKFFHHCIGMGMPSTVIRLGLLTASEKTGYLALSDIFTKLLFAMERGYEIKSEDLFKRLDLTPVDFAARSMVDIILKKSPENIYHVANPISLKVEDLVKAVEASRFHARPLAEHEFEVPELATLESLLPHHSFHLFKTTNTRFSTQRLEEIASASCPEPTLDFLVPYLNQIYEKNTYELSL